MSVELRKIFLRIRSKGIELDGIMQRRKVDVLHVQETNFKGSKACRTGIGFKLICHGEDRNIVVGVVQKERFATNLVHMKSMSHRVM